MFRITQPSIYQPQKRRSIPFHHKFCNRVGGSNGSVIMTNMLVEPWIIYYAEVCSYKSSMKFITADAGPGRIVIGACSMIARAHDIKQARETLPDPGTRIILIGNGIHPYF